MIRRSAGTDEASAGVGAALSDAERRGFRLAVLGRGGALVALAAFYFIAFPWPNNLMMTAVFVAAAALGLVALALVHTRWERAARFGLLATDTAAISVMLAFAPLSSGGDIPQNFIFLSGRHLYYFVLIAISVLTLSPMLVLWTGACAVLGLSAATSVIIAGMDRVSSFGDLPRGPTRDQFLSIVFDPAFLAIPVRVSDALVIALTTAIAALAVHRARNVVRAHAAAEEKRSRLQRLFGHYVPVQVAEQLAEAGRLAPEMREATIMFADIEGFTGLAERLPPGRVIALLNEFFGAATEVVDSHGGVVVNHVGDALIAAFNAPLAVDDYASRAIKTSLTLRALISSREFDGHRLRLRIGIATGLVAAGSVGGAGRQTYTVYGDTVNLAQRLERKNKELGLDCLVCGRTFEMSGLSSAEARAVGTIRVRGRAAGVGAFAVPAPRQA